MRLARSAGALALVLTVSVASVAQATTYRGAGVDDPRMAVKLKLRDGVVAFSYSDVLTECSNGDRLRYPGARHSTMLKRSDRFKGTISHAGQTSTIRGRVRSRRASGTIHYRLSYAGGECDSGQVEWRAKVR